VLYGLEVTDAKKSVSVMLDNLIDNAVFKIVRQACYSWYQRFSWTWRRER